METIKYCHPCGSDIMLDCELEYDPGEPANNDIESATCGPGCPPVAYLITAKIGSLDVMPILDPSIIEQIEVGACSMQD